MNSDEQSNTVQNNNYFLVQIKARVSETKKKKETLTSNKQNRRQERIKIALQKSCRVLKCSLYKRCIFSEADGTRSFFKNLLSLCSKKNF
jgi:hypothetical protein